MAKSCIIKFSADNITVTGKPLQEIRDKNLLELKRQNAEMKVRVSEEELADSVNRMIISKQKAEKDILEAILIAAMKKCKRPSDINIILDVSAAIKDSGDSVILEIQDMEMVLKDFESAEKQPWWLNCRELFKQLSPLVAYEKQG